MTKIFTYQDKGLAYTVTVYEDPANPGTFLADITVTEGAMDVNAVYFADDDMEGASASLSGPLNMNGANLDGERVQWDDAVKLSDPGLGTDGTAKDTYLTAGDTLTLELDIDSLDDIDIFGIRATSTTTPGGSIKAITDDPMQPEDDPIFDKVGFGYALDDSGVIQNGIYIREEDLPDGQDGTFENYLSYFDSITSGDPENDITNVESIVFYEITEGTDAGGNPVGIPQEMFRIDAPPGGFADADAVLDAYDAALDSGVLDGATADDEALQLMAALSLPVDAEVDIPQDDEVPLEEPLWI